MKAEAEALIIVEHCRDGSFALDDKTFTDAFFVSNTGVSIDWPAADGRLRCAPPRSFSG